MFSNPEGFGTVFRYKLAEVKTLTFGIEYNSFVMLDLRKIVVVI